MATTEGNRPEEILTGAEIKNYFVIGVKQDSEREIDGGPEEAFERWLSLIYSSAWAAGYSQGSQKGHLPLDC